MSLAELFSRNMEEWIDLDAAVQKLSDGAHDKGKESLMSYITVPAID